MDTFFGRRAEIESIVACLNAFETVTRWLVAFNAVETTMVSIMTINCIIIVPAEFNNGETSFLVFSSNVARSANKTDFALKVNANTVRNHRNAFATMIGEGVVPFTTNANVLFASTARFLVVTTMRDFNQTAFFIVGEDVTINALVTFTIFGINVAIFNFRHASVTLGIETGKIAVAFDAKVVTVIVDAVVDGTSNALGPVAGLGVPVGTNGTKVGAVNVAFAVGDGLQALIIDQNVMFLAL